jgi:hypothetical protein
MKSIFFMFIAAFLLTATSNAQSTVDSITSKYKLIPMPGALTIEQTFPVLGVYQLGGADATAMNMSTNTNTTGTTSNANASSTNATGSVSGTTNVSGGNAITVTLDSANKGMVWVEGLPQGKFKAFLKQSPATYRILSQKTVTGKQISEGTLYFDPATSMLHIALGKAFDDVDPTAIFALSSGLASTDVNTDNTVKVKVKTPTSKTKSKVTFYTATKVQTEAATEQSATGTFDSQLQQSQQAQETQSQPQQ